MNKRDKQILEGREPWWYTFLPVLIILAIVTAAVALASRC